ncbi:hypothetical protein [Erythrobacter colymbi]|uniref:hypothetical protein n=1 Tax=Erythrobacter colymbi TaxID=1161202 RepID=UPI00117F6F67|nr:hypothetical protein [Erythrobacter colymbi]
MGKRIDNQLTPGSDPSCPRWMATVTLRSDVSDEEFNFYEAADRKFLTECCMAGVFQQSIGPRDSDLLYMIFGSTELAATALLDLPAIAADIAELAVNRLRFFAQYDASSPTEARRTGDVTGHGIT